VTLEITVYQTLLSKTENHSPKYNAVVPAGPKPSPKQRKLFLSRPDREGALDEGLTNPAVIQEISAQAMLEAAWKSNQSVKLAIQGPPTKFGLTLSISGAFSSHKSSNDVFFSFPGPDTAFPVPLTLGEKG